MAEKSETRKVIEKGGWIALAIGFLGLAISVAGWGVKEIAKHIPSLSVTKSS